MDRETEIDQFAVSSRPVRGISIPIPVTQVPHWLRIAIERPSVVTPPSPYFAEARKAFVITVVASQEVGIAYVKHVGLLHFHRVRCAPRKPLDDGKKKGRPDRLVEGTVPAPAPRTRPIRKRC
jgi:hypothetical protein